MKPVLKSSVVFFLLNAYLHAAGAPLQQPGDMVSKGPMVVSPNLTKESLPVEIKEPVKVIDKDTSFNQIDTRVKIAASRLKENMVGLKDYLQTNGFNTDYCFMVDMSIPSGKKRFFVVNLNTESVELSSLVSHGSGSYKRGVEELTFSNNPNSNATSLGKYKIGAPYWGTYGYSYRLAGLDSSNNNALARSVVLHSDSYVPDKEVYPYPIYMSAGCPIVSPTVLASLGKYIAASKKPILLWIYY